MNSQFMSNSVDYLVLSKMSASTELAHIPHFHIPQPQTQTVNTPAAADHNITIPCNRKNWPHAKCYNVRAKKPKTQNQNHKVSQPAPAPAPAPGYIHVRARRGQATDSHSLAERIRREKISQRMKVLQTLVPGCHKVTGKALMLDEIINYVQSLQNQVEFLSMKLASVNPILYDFGMDNPEVFLGRPDSESEILNGNGMVANNSEQVELAYNNMAHPQQAELAYTFQTNWT